MYIGKIYKIYYELCYDFDKADRSNSKKEKEK